MFWVLDLSLGNLQRGKHVVDKGLEKSASHRVFCLTHVVSISRAHQHPPLTGTIVGTKLT